MLKKLFLILLLVLLPVFASQIPDGFEKVRELGGITEYEMTSNGLTILLMEEHSAPVVTFMVTYRVGSRNEVTGTTGATHILEHLMFKGTEKYNKEKGNSIDKELGYIGAMMNATTWLDRTNYYESIPNNYLELAVDIEADRMKNLLLREEDRQAEMTVVRNEFERGENSPFSALNKEIWAAAFQAHPYHHSTIGWRSDIENVPIEKLRAFYETFYWPNNSTVTVIGDFKTDEPLSLIKKYYGKIPRSPEPIPKVYTEEPEQQGPRRVQVTRAGQLGVVGIGYKVPEGAHEDTYALSILDKILTDGKTSRLYRALIDQNKAVNVFNFYVPFKDPSLFVSYAFITPGVEHKEVEDILLDEIEKIKTEGVTQEEVDRAVSQVTAETAYDRDGSFSIASQINEAIAMGDWTFYIRYPEEVKNVTPEDVKTVAEKYFKENSKTTGYFIPKSQAAQSEGGGSNMRSEPTTMEYYRNPDNESVPLAQDELSLADKITDENVEGIRVLTSKTGVDDVVTITGSLAAGDVFSPDKNSMIADLTGNMLDKGTVENDKFALAAKLENLGASINFSVSTHTLDFNAKCLTKDLPVVIDLLAEQLRYPAFNETELEKLKAQRAGALAQQLESTNSRAGEKLTNLIFPEGHPNNQMPVQKLIDDASSVTLADVKAFHEKYYGPASMILVAVGDVDKDTLEGAVKNSFGGWTGGIEHPEFDDATVVTESKTEIVPMEDKTSATLTIGQITGLQKTDEDYLPFFVANQVLGGGGFTGRLMSIIRDDEGLTYGIFSTQTGDIFSDGYWYISGTFSPDLLAQGYSSTMRELKRWVKDGITQEDLDKTKQRLVGSYKVQLATTNGLAGQLLSFIERGFGPEYMDEYPELVEALTLDEVNSTIQKYIDPDKVVVVVAGTVTEDDLVKN